MTILVIEGVDGSGKSTLARLLAQHLHLPLVHSGGREKYPGEINDRIRSYFDVYRDGVIFDRHPVVSQTLYRIVTPQQTSVDPDLITRFYDSKPFFIYCRPKGRALDRHVLDPDHGDTPEYIRRLKHFFPQLLDEYDRWAVSFAHYTYRIGEPLAPLLRTLGPDFLGDIQAFHEKFGLEYKGPPRPLPDELHDFRHRFLKEEVNEYGDNWKLAIMGHIDGLENQLDALVDLAYVLFGTAYLHGFPFAEAWRRVHAANMRKQRAATAADSKRGSTYDVVKPPGWVPPSHRDLVASQS